MILLYHNITEDALPLVGRCRGPGLPVSCFEQQLEWLRHHRQIVSLQDYLRLTNYGTTTVKNLVAITFDDGLASTFRRAYPLLQRWEAPATFFVSTSHLDGGRLLWFSYLNALCFDGAYDQIEVKGQNFLLNSNYRRRQSRSLLIAIARETGNPGAFGDELSSAYPLSVSSLEEYAGMSSEQLSLLGASELLECGAHTVNHPFLDKLSRDEQEEEINGSKQQLEKLTGKSVRYFAYPSGDYNHDTLELLEAIGFEAAFATYQRRVDVKERFEIVRIGIYSTSFSKFWLKAQGVVTSDLKVRLKTMWATKKPSEVLSANSG